MELTGFAFADAFAAIQNRYPHLPLNTQIQLAEFDAKVATEGPESVLEAPVFPARLAERHPFAN